MTGNENTSITRCGYVALIGAPNAGKSTLLNALVGSRLSIVTPKPQTTRGRVKGIAVSGNTQMVFVDTPGVFDAKPKFEKAMVAAAWAGAEEADIILFVVDASVGVDDDVKRVAATLQKQHKPAVLVLNKVDKVRDKTLLPALAQQLHGLARFDTGFMIAAARNAGVRDILSYLEARLPEGPWLFGDEEMTDAPERDIACEITREQCFLRLHEELPYGLMVEHESWEEAKQQDKRVIKIRQAIIVTRESHKKIILGKGGAMLRSIGQAARRAIGHALDAEVHLFLFVKVQENWKDDAGMFRKAGLEYKAE